MMGFDGMSRSQQDDARRNTSKTQRVVRSLIAPRPDWRPSGQLNWRESDPEPALARSPLTARRTRTAPGDIPILFKVDFVRLFQNATRVHLYYCRQQGCRHLASSRRPLDCWRISELQMGPLSLQMTAISVPLHVQLYDALIVRSRSPKRYPLHGIRAERCALQPHTRKGLVVDNLHDSVSVVLQNKAKAIPRRVKSRPYFEGC